MLTTAKEIARRELERRYTWRPDLYLDRSDIEANANGQDWVNRLYTGAKVHEFTEGGHGMYRDRQEIEPKQGAILIVFLPDYGEPQYEPGERILLEEFEGLEDAVYAIVSVPEELEGIGTLLSFDVEVMSK